MVAAPDAAVAGAGEDAAVAADAEEDPGAAGSDMQPASASSAAIALVRSMFVEDSDRALASMLMSSVVFGGR